MKKRSLIILISSVLPVAFCLVFSCFLLKDKLYEMISCKVFQIREDIVGDIPTDQKEDTAYKSEWENPNRGRDVNPLFLNSDAEYIDVEDIDDLRMSMVHAFFDDYFNTSSSEAVIQYWIEGARADSEYMCIYVTAYIEAYDEEEPYSFSTATVIKTPLNPPTTDYVAVSSSRYMSFSEACLSYYPGEIYDRCSATPPDDRDIYRVENK